MDAFGLLIPLIMIALFIAVARVLRAYGLRPDENFALPSARRGKTTVDS